MLKKIIFIIAFFITGILVLILKPYLLDAPDLSIQIINTNEPRPTQVQPVIEIQLLGRAGLSYDGSTKGRAHNIELGMKRIDSTIILPGEEFSYIKSLGPISASDGFSEEKAFRNGEITLGLGGGLCQVSTILFQAALSAGLPVTERQNHSFAVSFYPIGLDATYANPAPDLKFINDTNHLMIIKSSTKDKIATFEIYGVPDGRSATVGKAIVFNKTPLPPIQYIYDPQIPVGTEECENYSQIGYTAKRIYTVSYPDGTENVQEFISKYLPHARVCRTSVQKNPVIPISVVP